MSLFKAREWWSTTSNEEYAFDVLAVGNVDSSPSGENKIVTGSLHGTVRLYSPKKGFSASDSLFEQQLEGPILQLGLGRFIRGGRGVSLAVLFPMKLAVYSFERVEGADDTLTLQKAYEHKLERTAFNFASGPFDPNRDEDHLCVQSMDGQLSVFQQESFSFSRFLPNFLVPGPLVYVPNIACLVTTTSDLKVVAYKIQQLADATLSQHKESMDSTSSSAPSSSALTGKRAAPMWEVLLGEHISDLAVGRYSKGLAAGQMEVLALGSTTVFVLRGSTVRLEIRLDAPPLCFALFEANEANTCQNLLVCSAGGLLSVYKDSMLVWAAALASPAVALRVATFANVRGLICSLSSSGETTVSFLGTDPSASVVAGSKVVTSDMKYADMDEELRRLHARIRDSALSVEPRTVEKSSVVIHADVPLLAESSMSGSGYVNTTTTVNVRVRYEGHGVISAVSLFVVPPAAFTVAQDAFSISNLGSGQEAPLIPLVFHNDPNVLAATLTVTLTAVYTAVTSEPRSVVTTFDLPLNAAVSLIAPARTGALKYVIGTNQGPADLSILFAGEVQEALLAEPALAVSALKFQYATKASETVVVVVSKKEGRYLLQGDSLPAMCVVASSLLSRLAAHYPSLSATFAEDVPLDQYFPFIDEHHGLRTTLASTAAALEEHSTRLRVIQKRLLGRYRDKTPSSLASLEALFDETYLGLLNLAGNCEETQVALKAAAARLSGATAFIVLLLKTKYAMSPSAAAVLRGALCPNVIDSKESGWEEIVDVAIVSLLRGCLAKSDADRAIPQTKIVSATSTAKLKKHLTLMCDRLASGLTLDDGGDPSKAEGAAPPLPSEEASGSSA